MKALRGKKLNIYGGSIGIGTAQALGFTPVHMNIPEVYMAVCVLSLTKLPMELTNFVLGLGVPSLVILILIYVIYIILGCIMPGLAIIILTVSISYPVVMALGYDPIWFGVIIVLTNEMAVITPPVALNVYGIAGVAKDVPMRTIFRGILPFFLIFVLTLAIITALPQIATFLPSMMK